MIDRRNFILTAEGVNKTFDGFKAIYVLLRKRVGD